MEFSESGVILAGGGLLWRQSGRGKEVLLIYRDRYGDWTLPKGKVKATDRTWLEAALREVEEETGYRVVPFSFAGSISYLVEGVPKVVLFWNLSPLGESHFQPSEEVKHPPLWLPVSEAIEKLDYADEKGLVRNNMGLAEKVKIGG